jgi:DeoR family transcriptional regulator, fructose operon transcriptional repressor
MIQKMHSFERKSEIIGLLEETGKVEIGQLMERFGASRETVRRDLRDLEAEGVVRRTHGGALLNELHASAAAESPIVIREIRHYREKQAICREAAAKIQDGDIIFVDNSSTCIFLSDYIPADVHVTIVTNSVKLLLEESRILSPNHVFICLGGMFHSSNLSLYGNIALKNALEFYPNKAFISCTGIPLQNHVADASILEVDIKRQMIERSQEVILLADSSKFNKNGPILLCALSEIDHIITDQNIEAEYVQYLTGQGIRLQIAGR